MLKTLVVLIAIVCVANATKISSPLVPKPVRYQNDEGCYIPELNKVIAVNETAPSKNACAGYICQDNSYEYKSCEPDESVDSKKCNVQYNTNEHDAYPSCCPTITCISVTEYVRI